MFKIISDKLFNLKYKKIIKRFYKNYKNEKYKINLIKNKSICY